MQNRQGEVKNNIGNVEAKELIYTTCEHELRQGREQGVLVGGRCRVEGNEGGEMGKL